jgi:hypothetical protein
MLQVIFAKPSAKKSLHAAGSKDDQSSGRDAKY